MWWVATLYFFSVVVMCILPKRLQVHGRSVAVYHKRNIIYNYKRGGGTIGVYGYFYKNVNRIFSGNFNIGKLVAIYTVYVYAELCTHQVHELNVLYPHRFFIGIKHLKVFGGRAQRSKHGIKRKRIGAERKAAVAKLLLAATAVQQQRRTDGGNYYRKNKNPFLENMVRINESCAEKLCGLSLVFKLQPLIKNNDLKL